MLFLLLIVFGFGMWWFQRMDNIKNEGKSRYDFKSVWVLVPSLIEVVIIITLVLMISGLVNGRNLDRKISMYEEENIKIENQIDTVVTNYMKHESSTFEMAKGDSSITLVSLYPELKSDELVSKQIDTYNSNNKKIKKLKESQIDLSSTRWWVYFGS